MPRTMADRPTGHDLKSNRPPATAAPIIQLRDVRYRYPAADTEVLGGVSLDIAEGEYVCVLGENGSGKSTLAQLLNALILPTGGSVRACGIDAAAQPERTLELRRHVAMVFQHPDDQMVTSVVADDVAFGPENLGIPQPQIAKRVEEALSAVGMLPYAQTDPADLSGGQRQRVAIAGALAMRPRVLVLDEPAAMLDARGRRAIQRIARELSERGITVVHITHFMEDALLADRVVVMNAGRVAQEGAPDEVFSQRASVYELGLDLPFTLRLAERLAPAMPNLPLTGDAGELAGAISLRLRGRRPQNPDGDADASLRAREAARRGTNAEEGPSASDATPAIEFRDVAFSYADERNARKRPSLLDRLRRRGAGATDRPARGPLAVQGLSFKVPAGSLTALIGQTGSGKSTTVELACALKIPNGGTVLVKGVDTADLSRRALVRSAIGYVAQLPERQLFAATVFDDVAFGPRNLGLADEEVDLRVREALEEAGIVATPDLLERSPFALSGGQQRAVSIAGVLAMRTPILVLDEPMAGLDPAGQRRMRALIASLHASGRTIVVVTHDMDDVAELADHVVVLEQGRLAAAGTPRQVFTRAAEHVPGLPAPLAFARRLAKLGDALPCEPLTLDDLVSGLTEEVLHGAAR